MEIISKEGLKEKKVPKDNVKQNKKGQKMEIRLDRYRLGEIKKNVKWHKIEGTTIIILRYFNSNRMQQKQIANKTKLAKATKREDNK